MNDCLTWSQIKVKEEEPGKLQNFLFRHYFNPPIGPTSGFQNMLEAFWKAKEPVILSKSGKLLENWISLKVTLAFHDLAPETDDSFP